MKKTPELNTMDTEKDLLEQYKKMGVMHVMLSKNGKLIKNFYRYSRERFEDGAIMQGWQFLSLAQNWHYSGNEPEFLEKNLIKLEDLK